MRRICFILMILSLLANFGMANSAEIGNSNGKTTLSHMLLDISQMSVSELLKFKSDKNMTYWCELDTDFFISYVNGKMPAIPVNAIVKKTSIIKSDMSDPALAIKRGADSPLDEFSDELNIIYENGAHIIFQAPPNVFNQIAKKESNHFKLESLKQNISVAVNIKFFEIPDVKSSETMSVDVKRLTGYIQSFQDFKTRYTYAPGYLKAANFAVEEFKKLGYESKLVSYGEGNKIQYNVVAQKNLSSGKENFYIIGAHLDAMSQNPSLDAPGADDNASGSAGVLEVANIISKYPFSDKIRFVLFFGEELGLRGSMAYVGQLKASGDIKRTLGMVNLDMIGFDKLDPLSSLWQTKKEYDPFVANFLAVAKEGQKLKITLSYNCWGSDHVSFVNAGVPACLFIEDEYAANSNYHKTTDLIANLNPRMYEEITRIVAQGIFNILSKK